MDIIMIKDALFNYLGRGKHIELYTNFEVMNQF